jgi:hypothetical protein
LALLAWDCGLLAFWTGSLASAIAANDVALMAWNVALVAWALKSIFRGLRGLIVIRGIPFAGPGTWPRFKRELDAWLDDGGA